jgi:hypothetical protein
VLQKLGRHFEAKAVLQQLMASMARQEELDDDDDALRVEAEALLSGSAPP